MFLHAHPNYPLYALFGMNFFIDKIFFLNSILTGR
jgi:hypothetical protein